MNILELARHEKNLVVGLRRYFHENPELSQKEFKTMDFIEKKLNGWGDRNGSYSPRRHFWCFGQR